MQVRIVSGGGDEIRRPVFLLKQRAVSGHIPERIEAAQIGEFSIRPVADRDGAGGVMIVLPVFYVHPHNKLLRFFIIKYLGTLHIDLSTLRCFQLPVRSHAVLRCGRIRGQHMAAEGPVQKILRAVHAHIAVFRPVFSIPVPLPLPVKHVAAVGVKHVSIGVIPDVSINQTGIFFHCPFLPFSSYQPAPALSDAAPDCLYSSPFPVPFQHRRCRFSQTHRRLRNDTCSDGKRC